MAFEPEQTYSELDSFMVNLFSMGFQTEEIQHFLQSCKQTNVQPTVSDAVDFIIARENTEIPTSLPIDSNDYSSIEAGIPTVIGFNKSVNYKPLSPQTADPPTHKLPAPSQQPCVDRESFYRTQKQDKENLAKYKQSIKEMIQNDRSELRHYYPPANSIQQQAETPMDQVLTEQKKQKEMSRLSIRLLNGKTITRLFAPLETLGLVLSSLQEEYSLTEVTLSQAFPRVDYSSEDLLKSLIELGFKQGGSLVIKKPTQNSVIFGQASENTNSDATRPIPVPPVQQPALQMMAALQPNHDWIDQGKILGGEYINKSVFLTSVETKKSARKRFVVAMEITSLKELSFRIIIRRAKVNDLPRFNNLSPGEGQMVLARLIREDILSPKLVDMFFGCRMHTIDLTSCKLITNELLHRFNRIKSISKLVIKGSPYLTDKAVSFIGDMPHLNVLILEDCSNLTNLSCQSLSKLKSLKSLNLRATKVTDKGILHMIHHSGLVYIEELNLSSTRVTQAILLPLGAHCSLLRVLTMESTKVDSLPSLNGESTKINLENLREVDFSNCVFKEDTNFSDFFQFLNLKILKVYGTSISDFTFLKYLTLESIAFPRVIQNADGSSPFKFLMYHNLKQLNLTNCLSIDREDMTCIGNMHTLTELSLKNCRCLESKSLSSIVSLSQLTYLDLEHTMLTDDTAIYIFPHVTLLVYLNLSGTQVSNLLLKSRMLNNCSNLTILNLNYTRVSNSGLSYLSIPYLNSLFLNGTFANEHTENIVMENCINLKNLTLNNLHADNTVNSDREDD